MAETFVTVEEAAVMMRVRAATIRGWIKDGRLRAMRIPVSRRYRINTQDLEALVEEVAGPSEAPGSEAPVEGLGPFPQPSEIVERLEVVLRKRGIALSGDQFATLLCEAGFVPMDVVALGSMKPEQEIEPVPHVLHRRATGELCYHEVDLPMVEMTTLDDTEPVPVEPEYLRDTFEGGR